MPYRKYTEEKFIESVKTSRSIAQLLQKLGIAPHGGNYRVAKNYIKKLNLDTSHMTGQGWNKNNITGSKRSIQDYLSNKYYIQSHALRKRLIKEKLFFEICSLCCLKNWLNQPIPLELHHIDGNHKNNNITNLKLLCPNCHTLTDNYRGKGKSKNLARYRHDNKVLASTEFDDIH